ncbi:transcriptional repressor [Pedobacter frigidisoli]|uniref:Transcriptional repressor n=1 Tax=Pedobacter frigidisoli TaxID=2530455 RepID=A0A4R0NS11_9SPHI|nr:transcriptional repressor [Pedobacter frigidisoli]TCD02165.1 transcriptional repressor [Pedobacter frigidisoli]
MDNNTALLEELLVKKGLKRTAPRLQVLEILSGRDSATSQPYLEQLMGKSADRVTLYRVLQAFEEKGIIHKVLDSHGTANYAICSGKCTAKAHHDEHVHFNCNRCQKIYCLDNVKVPSFKVPAGFRVNHLNLIATGTCAACADQINSSLLNQ